MAFKFGDKSFLRPHEPHQKHLGAKKIEPFRPHPLKLLSMHLLKAPHEKANSIPGIPKLGSFLKPKPMKFT